MRELPVRSVERVGKTVVRAEVTAGTGDWEWWMLLRSDAHHDNAHCRQDAEKYHLDLAKERGAGIVDIGDLHCAMQGKYDPRADRSQLRDEHRRNNYFDQLIDTATDFYSPYANNWLLMSPGNHETSVLDRHGTNLTERLCENLRRASSGPTSPALGTYQGWLQIRFAWGSTHSRNYRIRYTHGYGGGGPVTKDTIQTNRQLAYTEGADFLLSGHTHDSWYMIQPRECMDDYGNAGIRNVALIKVGGYKDEFSDGSGWAVGKGHPPRPIGGWWLQFYYHRKDIRYRVVRTEDF